MEILLVILEFIDVYLLFPIIYCRLYYTSTTKPLEQCVHYAGLSKFITKAPKRCNCRIAP